jgi:hypothetical protein
MTGTACRPSEEASEEGRPVEEAVAAAAVTLAERVIAEAGATAVLVEVGVRQESAGALLLVVAYNVLRSVA